MDGTCMDLYEREIVVYTFLDITSKVHCEVIVYITLHCIVIVIVLYCILKVENVILSENYWEQLFTGHLDFEPNNFFALMFF